MWRWLRNLFRRKTYEIEGMEEFQDEVIASMHAFLDYGEPPDAMAIMDRHPELFGPTAPFHDLYVQHVEKVRRESPITLH